MKRMVQLYQYNVKIVLLTLEGGCKHAIAFLTCPHRRSEEPSRTSVTCYWKKSELSPVGTSLKFIRGKDMDKGSRPELNATNFTLLNSVMDYSKRSLLSTTSYLKKQDYPGERF